MLHASRPFFALVFVGVVAACGGRGHQCPLRSCEQPSAMAKGEHMVVPGVGIGGVRVGVSTPEDVLRAWGCDAKINRFGKGPIDQIIYDYDGSDKYAPDRPDNRARPSGFRFKGGVLERIDVGVYQKELHTTGGITVYTPLQVVTATLGPGEYETGNPLDTLRYPALGLELWISHDDARTVNSFYVIVPKAGGGNAMATTGKLNGEPALDPERPFVLSEGNGWKLDGKDSVWPADAPKPTLYIGALALKAKRVPLADIPQTRIGEMFNTTLLANGSPAKLDGLDAIEFQTDSSYGKPPGAIGHSWDVERCIQGSNGVFCVRCSQYAAMKDEQQGVQWASEHVAVCQAAIDKVKLRRP
ncbi:MAG: hypothetical protein ACXVEE_28215 [Polyangiales bacterium]